MVHFMRYFRQYLMGRMFLVRTDHSALTWLRRTPEPIGQQARWLEVMEEFHFRIEHRPVVCHGNADALSGYPCKSQHCACHNNDQLTKGSESISAVKYEGDDGTTEVMQPLEVSAVRQEYGVGPSIGKAADVPAPGTSDSEDPWSLEGMQAAE